MSEGVGDPGAEDDPRVRAADREGAPACPLARGEKSSLADREAHRATIVVEEAGIHGNDSGEG